MLGSRAKHKSTILLFPPVIHKLEVRRSGEDTDLLELVAIRDATVTQISLYKVGSRCLFASLVVRLKWVFFLIYFLCQRK